MLTDPIATPNAQYFMPGGVKYVNSAEEAINGADTAFIATEWEEFKNLESSVFAEKLKQPVVFDGRNCYDLEQVKEANLDYYSIGRPVVKREKVKELTKTKQWPKLVLREPLFLDVFNFLLIPPAG